MHVHMGDLYDFGLLIISFLLVSQHYILFLWRTATSLRPRSHHKPKCSDHRYLLDFQKSVYHFLLCVNSELNGDHILQKKPVLLLTESTACSSRIPSPCDVANTFQNQYSKSEDHTHHTHLFCLQIYLFIILAILTYETPVQHQMFMTQDSRA